MKNNMNQEDIKKVFEALGGATFNIAGDFVIEKNNTYTIENVETGGVGMQFATGQEAPNDNNGRKHKGGRPKRTGKAINKSFIYDVGDETNVRLQFLYNGLIALQWIKADTQLKSFLSLFSGNETTSRVVWTGEINALSELFRELVMRKRIVQLPQSESLWVMVNARFWDKEGNHEFGNKRLGSARASLENKDSIELLVSAMNPQVPIEELRKASQSRK